MDLKIMTDPEELKKVFINEIIRDGKDTKDPYWQKISAETQQYIDQFCVKYVSPKARVLASLMAPRITRYSQFASEQKIPNLPELKKRR